VYLVGYKGGRVLIVNADSCRHQLHLLNEEINLKRFFTSKGWRPVKLFHDKARPHITRSVKDTLISLYCEVMEHPGYNPDIAPSDYRSMHNSLTDIHFKAFYEVRKWVDDFIKSKDRNFFYNGIHSLPKMIDNNGKDFDDYLYPGFF